MNEQGGKTIKFEIRNSKFEIRNWEKKDPIIEDSKSVGEVFSLDCAKDRGWKAALTKNFGWNLIVQAPFTKPSNFEFQISNIFRRGTNSMFVIGNFLAAIAKILDIALTLYMWIIIARAVISWVNPDPRNPIIRFLNTVTEPVLYRIRRLLPISFGGIDFSPILVLLVIIFVQSFLVRSLAEMAMRMGG